MMRFALAAKWGSVGPSDAVIPLPCDAPHALPCPSSDDSAAMPIPAADCFRNVRRFRASWAWMMGKDLLFTADLRLRPPSSRYSGERAGERGKVRSTSVLAGLVTRLHLRIERASVSLRRSPLSPTLSPAYREEGVIVTAY